ncbi:carbohydrate ABC transporter permease [Diplocloster agilis]|uniref:Sugar ABC transporter permease n=1 Tax=Diplocloster agilis TaxID=2850323 RepID=A0A949K0F5_9FIRM|nr:MULTISPECIES: sugar ABC transporter permease [Lachnospiraceae]MBU9736480.1 sugar ABC transporter permease [Diplocloster agilis]MBU9744332.1 sugar ABC transporter permease [Diplocloster agilis]MCU6734970.1 sugar ABC transporter permease [Suonthocola fibrivorans]SCJ60707.1 Inner membrane ABC transporter permease protein ycjO [uncultured Clostridium sp.]
MNGLIKKKIKGTCFILPAFLVHLVIVLIPACSMFYYAFTKWNGLNEPQFNGLDNFRRMLTDYDFLFALKNNVIWMSIFLIVPLILGLGMALIFTKIGKIQLLFRSLCFLPYVVSATVAGKIFSIFYSPYSGIGSFFEQLGIRGLADFAPLGNEHQALYAAAFVDNWHWWGFVLVLMMSALHQVDAALYEAAQLEGANSWQILKNVTLPQIKPTIVSYFVFVIIAAFTTFDYVWIMTQGGPAGATEVFSTRIYKTTFINFEAGYGSALSLSVCLLALSVYFILKLVQKRGREQL